MISFGFEYVWEDPDTQNEWVTCLDTTPNKIPDYKDYSNIRCHEINLNNVTSTFTEQDKGIKKYELNTGNYVPCIYWSTIIGRYCATIFARDPQSIRVRIEGVLKDGLKSLEESKY